MPFFHNSSRFFARPSPGTVAAANFVVRPARELGAGTAAARARSLPGHHLVDNCVALRIAATGLVHYLPDCPALAVLAIAVVMAEADARGIEPTRLRMARGQRVDAHEVLLGHVHIGTEVAQGVFDVVVAESRAGTARPV